MLGQPVHSDPVDAAAAPLHAIARLHPLRARNDLFAWLAACTVPGLNGITVPATPEQALQLVRAAENGEPGETAIATQLTASPAAAPAKAAEAPGLTAFVTGPALEQADREERGASVGMIGRTYQEHGQPVVVLVRWSGNGPRNVLIRQGGRWSHPAGG